VGGNPLKYSDRSGLYNAALVTIIGRCALGVAQSFGTNFALSWAKQMLKDKQLCGPGDPEIEKPNSCELTRMAIMGCVAAQVSAVYGGTGAVLANEVFKKEIEAFYPCEDE
jgi:hypothetical protein